MVTHVDDRHRASIKIVGPTAPGVNDAPDRLDVMVGSDEVEVTGRHADGRETPLLRAGRWLV